MAEICRAKVEGDTIGSTRLVFEPGETVHGEYRFDIGTAGSTSLLFQALLPALALSGGTTRLKLIGGTHVPWSPPFQFIERSFIRALSVHGLRAEVDIGRWGYYPKGGGEMTATIHPTDDFAGMSLSVPGSLADVSGLSAVSMLPMSIADRQASAATERLAEANVPCRLERMDTDSYGPGTFVYLCAEYGNIALGFSALGAKGKRAEAVGKEAADALISHMRTGACVDEHLADQMLVYMALADGPSRMSVSRITKHLTTNADVIRQFLPDVSISIDGDEGGTGTVEVSP
jgi:RNA 3'-terminal phosphate cyclase (ATP)